MTSTNRKIDPLIWAGLDCDLGRPVDVPAIITYAREVITKLEDELAYTWDLLAYADNREFELATELDQIQPDRHSDYGRRVIEGIVLRLRNNSMSKLEAATRLEMLLHKKGS